MIQPNMPSTVEARVLIAFGNARYLKQKGLDKVCPWAVGLLIVMQEGMLAP